MRGFDLQLRSHEENVAIFDIVVPSDLAYLEGHFPGDPLVPGVAQIVALGEEPARQAWPDLGASAGLRRVKFMEALRPGDRLELKLERRKPTEVTMRIRKGDLECSRGTLLFG